MDVGSLVKPLQINLTLRSEVRVPEAAGCNSLPSWWRRAQGVWCPLVLQKGARSHWGTAGGDRNVSNSKS